MFRLTSALAGAALCMAATSAFSATSFPDKPIHLIVPYPAGGIVDIVARTIADQVSRDWNQPVIVEDKPGAQSNIGTSYVARSEPDGYTWIISGPAILANPTIYPNSGWDAIRDFKCVGLSVWNQSVIVVPAAMPVKTLKDFVAKAKEQPGHLNYGTPGVGSSNDLSAKKFFRAAGIKMTTVGYKGQPPALIDLINNQFEVVALTLALPHIKDGKIKPLATLTHTRIKELPDVPTIEEAGYADAAFVPWYGIYVPAKTPDDIVKAINAGINKALENPTVRDRLAKSDIPGKSMSVAELATLMKTDETALAAVAKATMSEK
jgi:tripartite-type tricarboxylate transporter receptor subunit TctC